MTWTFIPAKLCLIYDDGLISLQRISSIEELIRYSRVHCLNFERWINVWIVDSNWYFPFEFWTVIPTEFVWFMIVDLFQCNCLNFDRSMVWFSIPANIVWIDSVIQWLNYDCWLELIFPFDFLNSYSFWLPTWTFIPAKRCLIYDGGLISLQMIDRWIDSVFPRTLFDCRTVNQMFELLTRTEIFLLNFELLFLPNLFDVWLLTWTVISVHLFDRRFCSREIIEPLFLSDRLNFVQWLELLFPRIIFLSERLNFDRWIEPIFPRNCWLEPLFLSERMNFDRWIESLPECLNFWSIDELIQYSRDNYSRANVWIL